MLVIFCDQSIRGGVQVFNEIIESKLNELGYVTFTCRPKIFRLKRISLLSYIESGIATSIRNRKNFPVLVQYGNFYDLLMLPMLHLFSKKISCIMHVNQDFKHLRNVHLRRFSRYVLHKHCHTLLYLTDSQKKILKPHPHCVKIPTVIDDHFFTQDRSAEISDYYLFLGRISKKKGVDLLLQTFKRLFANTRTKLKIAGGFADTSYKKTVTNYISDNDLGGQVELLGEITSIDEKIRLIDSSLALVYPSFNDTLPLVPIEAFSRGKLCLCSDLPGTREFVELDQLLFNSKNENEFQDKWSQLHRNIENITKLSQRITKKTIQCRPLNLAMQLVEHGVI